jgi:peptidoglycan hydrolase-like protein with peptidoglycan-binding domain
MTNRTMYDALDLTGIPTNAQMVAYYPHDSRTNGSVSRFSASTVLVTIDNHGNHTDCDVLDVEPGAAWPPSSVVDPWLAAKQAQGKTGTIYSNLANIGAVRAATKRTFFWWAAQWTNVPHSVPGSVATQYEGAARYDISLVTDASWPGAGKTPAGPPASGVSHWPDINQGARGNVVKVIQYLLGARGHAVTVDGDFGPRTKSAVEAFQRSAGLPVNGGVGSVTWPKLIVTVLRGSTGDAVMAVQLVLKVKIDGDFGPSTQAAVRSFQSSHGLSVDGVVGPNTWNALVNSL